MQGLERTTMCSIHQQLQFSKNQPSFPPKLLPFQISKLWCVVVCIFIRGFRNLLPTTNLPASGHSGQINWHQMTKKIKSDTQYVFLVLIFFLPRISKISSYRENTSYFLLVKCSKQCRKSSIQLWVLCIEKCNISLVCWTSD